MIITSDIKSRLLHRFCQYLGVYGCILHLNKKVVGNLTQTT